MKMRRVVRPLVLVAVVALLAACGGGGGASAASTLPPAPSPTATPTPTPTPSAQLSITSDQKLRMERLSSVFENGTIMFQYGYAENIGDGRGITCGRVGFTTGTGDWYQVVKAYTAQKPSNPLAPFLPRLAQLAAGSMPNPDTSGLTGMIAATAAAGSDPVMQQVQDGFVDSMIYNPALAIAQSIGATKALTVAVLYDGVLTHGLGSGPDSLDPIVASTTAAVGGRPASGVAESTWLRAFIAARRQDMLHPQYAPSAAAWAAAVARLDIYDRELTRGNLDLNGPIDTLTYGVSVP